MVSDEIKQVPSRRARNSLSRELILDAAHSIARAGEEISLRGVAAILECSPMALYRHFPDKQDLLLGLLDRVIGSINLGNEDQPWEERLLSIAKDHLKTLQSNQWAIPLLFQNPDPGPAVREVGEAILGSLKQGGATNENAVSTFSAILALNYGWAGFTALDPHAPSGKTLGNKLNARPNPTDGFPETLDLWSEFENLGSDAHHKIAVMKLIRN